MNYKVIISAICIAVLSMVGCAGLSQTPAELSVCAAPDATSSWICSIANRYNFTVEDMDSLLLDANAVAMISGAYNKEQARKVIKKLMNDVSTLQLSYTGLIQIVLKDVEDADLLLGIISRRLMLFKSDVLISDFDKALLLTHLQHQLNLVGG